VETLKVRRELALCTGRSGGAVEAARLLRELIPDMTRAMGADHRHVVSAREELAYWDHRLQSTGGGVAAGGGTMSVPAPPAAPPGAASPGAAPAPAVPSVVAETGGDDGTVMQAGAVVPNPASSPDPSPSARPAG
jgi:hypothetical protein